MEVHSIDFPRSFALDAMHLYWENVVPTLFDHWSGRFFRQQQYDEAPPPEPEEQAVVPGPNAAASTRRQ